MAIMKQAFTLAEVLITLAIIGVVAAMTIPTLITKMSQRAANARKDTIEARLLDGINRYSALEDGLSQHYDTTYDFLVGLSKHYKMAQICKADEITNCIPYSTINYTQDGEDKTIEVSTLTSIDSFMGEGKDDYLAPASFITIQGTPMVMALKKDCAWDMGKAMRDVADSGCIAYMYDENGTRNPNKIGTDWINHGLSITGGSGGGAEIAKINDVKIMEVISIDEGLYSSECEIEKAKNYGIEGCSSDLDITTGHDIWAASMKYCHDKGWRLPNEAESLAIVNGLFKDGSGNHPSGTSWSKDTYKIDLDLVSILRIKERYSLSIIHDQDSYDFALWGSLQEDSLHAYYRSVSSSPSTYWNNGLNDDTYRSDNSITGLCISD